MNNQWYLERINFSKIWPVLEKQTNFINKPVTIAVIEEGMDINHVDLKENIFYNVFEIPNDGLDNDQNGYIDDYYGLNMDFMTGNKHPIFSHGTFVAGIIGGVSNNMSGISGMSKYSKIMPVTGVNNIAKLFKAFQYVYDQKKLFINSNGSKGTNITVVNLSLGTRRGSDISGIKDMWCEFHDLLGSVGIVSCGSAINDLIDVEIEPELPSSCSSPYLINVTNMDSTNNIYDAGFSKKLMHLAAPGSRIYGLNSNNRYGYETGTSFAAPQVSSLVGILSSLSCDYYQNLSISSPSESAKYLVESVLRGVTPSINLQNKTITGGYLNVESSLEFFSKNCRNLNLDIRSDSDRFAIESIYFRSPTEINIKYTVPEYGQYKFMVTDINGKKINTIDIDYKPFELRELNFEIPEIQTSKSLLFFLINKERADFKHLFLLK